MDFSTVKDILSVIALVYGGYKFVRSYTEETFKSFVSAQVNLAITPVRGDIASFKKNTDENLDKLSKEVDGIRTQLALAYSAISGLKDVEIAKGDSIREATDKMKLAIQQSDQFIRIVKKLTGETAWMEETQVVPDHEKDALPNPDTLPERKKLK